MSTRSEKKPIDGHWRAALGAVLAPFVPRPYKAALVSLAGEYAQATQAYVESE